MHIFLENVHIGMHQNHIDLALQYVIRPMTTEYHDYRDTQVVLPVVFRAGDEALSPPSWIHLQNQAH